MVNLKFPWLTLNKNRDFWGPPKDMSCRGIFPLCNVMKKYCAKNTGNRLLSVVWDRKQQPRSRSRHQVKRPRLMPCLFNLLRPETKTTRSVSRIDSLGKHKIYSIPPFLPSVLETWLYYNSGVVMLWSLNLMLYLWCIFNAICIACQKWMCNTINVDFVADIWAREGPGLCGKKLSHSDIQSRL